MSLDQDPGQACGGQGPVMVGGSWIGHGADGPPYGGAWSWFGGCRTS